jgi:endoglucanase
MRNTIRSPRSPWRLLATGFLSLWLGHAVFAQVVRPIPVPGRVEAENYDTNGPGISYYDDGAGNAGAVWRTDDVDIKPTTDTGGGYNVGWIGSGEWLNYTVNVAEAAVYQFSFRVASASGIGNIQISLDGRPLCTVSTPFTGNWQGWQTVTISNLALPVGQRLLRAHFKTGGLNFNYIQITKQGNLSGSFLRASGQQIVDGTGHNVLLRGMGLGNWMLQEPYMMDVAGIVDNQQQLKAKIAELVGTNHMDTFYAAWLTNYFREADVQALAESGFNSIRLPMHYALFTLPVEQEPVPGQNTWLPGGFQLVDNLLSWCESNQIYLILDMHACPGGQGYDKPISDYNPPTPSLWENAANRAKLVALWRELASRYADRTWIGGYDLINEPNWSFENDYDIHGCSDQTNAPLRQLLVELTMAIRQVDTNHLIILEGNCWASNYRGILPPWDANLAISFHKYWDEATAASLQPWTDLRDQWNMPVWLGESGENSNEWFRDVVRFAEQANLGWSWWPWKKLNSVAGTVTVQKPAGYDAILNYWRGTGPRPTTNAALAALLQLAQAARFENCVTHADVFDSLLRPETLGATLPFKSNQVPGTIFAADYDLGRIGEAYADNTTNSNSGGVYRNDSVDIQACTDASPAIGFNVGWLDAGDWMKYTVPPIAPGPYAVSARVAANSPGGAFYLDVAGSNVTGLINVPATGGWQSWTTLLARIFTNAQPTTAFKLVVASSGFNLNWLRIDSAAPAVPGGLTATVTNTQVGLNWTASSGATSYKVKRSITNSGPHTTIAAGITSTNHTDSNLTNGVTYSYVVSATGPYGESANSLPAAASIPPPSLHVDSSADGVTLSWPASAANFSLCSSTNLTPPVVWLPVSNNVVSDGTTLTVTIPLDGGSCFFRLATDE